MRQIRQQILVAIKDPRHPNRSRGGQGGATCERALGAELELFHSISSPLYIDAYLMNQSTAIERKMRSARITELEKIARPLRARGLKVTVAAAWDYPVYEAIVRRALRMKADLVIAERHAGRHIVPGLLEVDGLGTAATGSGASPAGEDQWLIRPSGSAREPSIPPTHSQSRLTSMPKFSTRLQQTYLRYIERGFARSSISGRRR